MKPFPGGDSISRVWYIYLHLVEIIWLMFLPILLDFVGNQEPGGFKEFCLPLLTATFCLYPIWRTYVRTAWQYFFTSYTAMDPDNCENTWMQVPGCALLQPGWFVGSHWDYISISSYTVIRLLCASSPLKSPTGICLVHLFQASKRTPGSCL